MIPKNRLPTHPGQILLLEFMVPLELTQVAFAKHLGISVQRLNELINGKRGVTPETAWLLSSALRTSPQFWMNLQATYDLATHKPDRTIAPIANSA
jgi:antitoxin HigA-1